MNPITGAVTSLINALQTVAADLPAAAQQPAQLSALMDLAGREVAMTLLGQAAEGGVSLALPSGQVVTAQGQLPYPDGTQLLVRVLAGSGTDAGVRLQIRQAAPAAQPAILAPLGRGEASTLLASLDQPDPPPGLADLAGLFRLLGPGTGAARPDRAQVQAAVDTLPASAQAALKTLLGVPAGTSGADLASALDIWLAGGADPGAAPARGQAAVPDPLPRFQALLDRHPDLDPGNALGSWMRRLLGAQADPAAVRAGAEPTPAQALATLLAGRTGAAAEAPETWETWLRSSVKVLSDPATAPQSAPFHAAQAREGTAYYEIPLPWAPQQPLQMWVESDRDPRDPRRDPDAEVQRVLVGLSFTNLGETRLGLARDRGGLRVRVWTEHPDLLAADRARMEAELQDLGQAVDLRILPLDPGPEGTIPSLRSLVGGSGLEALG